MVCDRPKLNCLLFSQCASRNLAHPSLEQLLAHKAMYCQHIKLCANSSRYAFQLELTFKGNNFAGRVHDGAVCRDGPADGIVGVCHINDDNLGLLTHFLPYADELVGLHGQSAESNVGWVDSQVLELRYKYMICFSSSPWPKLFNTTVKSDTVKYKTSLHCGPLCKDSRYAGIQVIRGQVTSYYQQNNSGIIFHKIISSHTKKKKKRIRKMSYKISKL